MARNLNDVLASLPAKRRNKIAKRTEELRTLKDLRQAVERTQADLAATLGVGQDTVSRIERRSDMLLSTLRRYVEAIGGSLELVAQFPGCAPLIIDRLAAETTETDKAKRQRPRARRHGKRPTRRVA